MYRSDCTVQVAHPGRVVVLPCRSFDVIFSYDSGESSLPVPMATAVSFRS